jgi:hypothetical protein
MNFSVAKVRPFRSLGLYRSSGKHAASRGGPESAPRQAVTGGAHRLARAGAAVRVPGRANRKAPGQDAPAGEHKTADPGEDCLAVA